MEIGIGKCNTCSQEVSEVGQIYYSLWEKKKDDFGLGRREKIFCEKCWKDQEKYYRNYPCDSEEITRAITKYEIEKNGITYAMTQPKKSEWKKNRLLLIPKTNLLEREMII